MITNLLTLLVGGGLIGGVFTWLGQRTQSRSQVKAAEIESSAPAWSSFLAEVKDENEKQKAWLEQRVKEQDLRIVDMKQDIARLKALIQDVERKYEFALDAIRRFRRHHEDSIVQVHADVERDL